MLKRPSFPRGAGKHRFVSPDRDSYSHSDDNTLYSSDDDSDNLSTLSSGSLDSLDSFGCGSLPFRLSRSQGRKSYAYEAWCLDINEPDRSITRWPMSSDDEVHKQRGPQPLAVNVSSQVYEQAELMDMHLKALDQYHLKHKRCLPLRLVAGKAKTYEEDLDAQIQRLPDAMQTELNRLLSDREEATSDRFHYRVWEVVLMREQLQRRFADASPQAVKRHKFRFWKNKSVKTQPTEFLFVIRGRETKTPAEPEKGFSDFKRHGNPWERSDRDEIHQRNREIRRTRRDEQRARRTHRPAYARRARGCVRTRSVSPVVYRRKPAYTRFDSPHRPRSPVYRTPKPGIPLPLASRPPPPPGRFLGGLPPGGLSHGPRPSYGPVLPPPVAGPGRIRPYPYAPEPKQFRNPFDPSDVNSPSNGFGPQPTTSLQSDMAGMISATPWMQPPSYHNTEATRRYVPLPPPPPPPPFGYRVTSPSDHYKPSSGFAATSLATPSPPSPPAQNPLRPCQPLPGGRCVIPDICYWHRPGHPHLAKPQVPKQPVSLNSGCEIVGLVPRGPTRNPSGEASRPEKPRQCSLSLLRSRSRSRSRSPRRGGGPSVASTTPRPVTFEDDDDETL